MRTYVLNNQSPSIKEGEFNSSTIGIIVPEDMRSYNLFLVFMLPSGEKVFTPSILLDQKSMVTYPLPAAVLSETGRVQVELQGYETLSYIKSVTYSFTVVKSLTGPTNGTGSELKKEDYLPWYTEAAGFKEEVKAIAGEFERPEAQRVSKEIERVTAEGTRTTNEAGRVTAESARVTAEAGRVTAENARAATLALKADKSTTYTKTEVDNKYAPLATRITDLESLSLKKYGVRRTLSATSTALERVWDSVGKVANFPIYDSAVQDDFDSGIYPYNAIKECKITANGKITYKGAPGYILINGDYMAEIPLFYATVQDDGATMIWGLSQYPQTDFYIPQAFYREDGTVCQKIYVGQYKTGKAGTFEVANLQVTTGATAAGNVTVTLDGVATTVALLATENTPDLVAGKIRATEFAGWATGGTGSAVTFTASTIGTKTDAVYSAGTTGSVGIMTTQTHGAELMDVSRPDLVAENNRDLASFRAGAVAKGIGWQIVDIWYKEVLDLLYLVKYADTNSQAKTANGLTNFRNNAADTAKIAETAVNRIVVLTTSAEQFEVGQTIMIGTYLGDENVAADRTITAITAVDGTTSAVAFDGAPVNIAVGNFLSTGAQKTGQTKNLERLSGGLSGTNGRKSFKMCGLEDIYGNVYELIDGLLIQDFVGQVCTRPSKYSSTLTADYKPLGYANRGYGGNAFAGGYVTELGRDKQYPGVKLTTLTQAGSSTGYADYYYSNTGLRGSSFGGYVLDGARAGLFYWVLSYVPTVASWHIGSRLMYKPQP